MSKKTSFTKTSFSIPAQVPTGLFDKIILAVEREKDLRQTRKVAITFLMLLCISVTTMPFSSILFARQWKQSGVSYFILSAASNTDVFVVSWQDFLFSIFESLPMLSLVILLVNTSLALFTIRLFLYKKGVLLTYLHYPAA